MSGLTRFQKNQLAYEGHVAQRGGKQRSDNPYVNDPERAQLWIRGFDVAEKKPEINPDPPRETIADPSVPRGVGGWLMLLVIGLTFLAPLRNMADAANAISDLRDLPGDWSGLKAFIFVSTLLISIVSIAAGVALWKGRTRTVVAFAIAALWIIGPLGHFVVSAGISMFVSRATGATIFNAEFAGGLAGALIFAMIWTIYLSVSKRVKATYARE